MPEQNWGTIHPSVFTDAGRLLRWTAATPRPHGAVRIRCAGCGEMHMLAHQAEDAAVIVGAPGPA